MNTMFWKFRMSENIVYAITNKKRLFLTDTCDCFCCGTTMKLATHPINKTYSHSTALLQLSRPSTTVTTIACTHKKYHIFFHSNRSFVSRSVIICVLFALAVRKVKSHCCRCRFDYNIPSTDVAPRIPKIYDSFVPYGMNVAYARYRSICSYASAHMPRQMQPKWNGFGRFKMRRFPSIGQRGSPLENHMCNVQHMFASL